MEVAWTDAAGEQHQWSSWTDPLCGWFEAERLLPSSAANITIRFEVRTVVAAVKVCAVDRGNGCRWLVDESSGAHPQEVFTVRSAASAAARGDEARNLQVDALFELSGPALHCYVWRAWNAGRRSEFPESWEVWEDEASRPLAEATPEVLEAADAAAPPSAGAGQPMQHCTAATIRLIAAARALQDKRGTTLQALRDLDGVLSEQWVAINSVNTVSAGLGVCAAVALFLAPPATLGLCLGSALFGGGACAGDAAADHVRYGELRALMSREAWNAFAVAELEKEWFRARTSLAQSRDGAVTFKDGCYDPERELGLAATYGAQFGTALASVILEASCEVSTTSVAAARAATATEAAMPAVARTLGVVGAVVSVGVAIHGWSNTKSIQEFVRSTLLGVTFEIARTQSWLAAMGQLECTICRCGISLSHEAGCCRDSLHCFHTLCLRLWSAETDRGDQENLACPTCGELVGPRREVLEELLSGEPPAVVDVAPAAAASSTSASEGTAVAAGAAPEQASIPGGGAAGGVGPGP